MVALCLTLQWPHSSLNRAFPDRDVSPEGTLWQAPCRGQALWRFARAMCLDCRRAHRWEPVMQVLCF